MHMTSKKEWRVQFYFKFDFVAPQTPIEIKPVLLNLNKPSSFGAPIRPRTSSASGQQYG